MSNFTSFFLSAESDERDTCAHTKRWEEGVKERKEEEKEKARVYYTLCLVSRKRVSSPALRHFAEAAELVRIAQRNMETFDLFKAT